MTLRLDRAAAALAVSGAAAAVAATALVVRDPHVSGSFLVCPVVAMTGLSCPGCGSLRAIHDVLTGSVAEAFAHNVLTLPALLWLAWWWVARVAAVAGRSWVGPPNSSRAATVLLVVLAVFTVVRNLPGSPLAP